MSLLGNLRRRRTRPPDGDAPGTLHVGVIGAGFGGLAAARRLGELASEEHAALRVTLIDRHNYHTFQPLLYQVATAGLEPQSIGHSIRGIVRRLPVDVVLGTVVDIGDGRITMDDGSIIDVDMVVIAVGATTADYGIEGVAEHAYALKSLPDATKLRNHILSTFERVENRPDLIDDGALTYVIAGGGPTGVELSGALSELIDRVVSVDHPRVDTGRARILLSEMMDDILGPYSASSRDYARRALEERGVEVLTGTAIEAVRDDCVELSTGERIPTSTVVWTAGVTASPLAGVLGLPLGKGGRIEVAADLRAAGSPHTFVIGDVAAATGPDGSPLPQLAPVAIQQGRHVAEQILRLRRGEPTRPFHYRDRGTMATIGRGDAVAELPYRLRLHGAPAWLAWLGLHLVWLVGFRNRASVLLNWGYNYLTSNHAARLILRQDEPREDVAVAAHHRAGDDGDAGGDAGGHQPTG